MQYEISEEYVHQGRNSTWFTPTLSSFFFSSAGMEYLRVVFLFK